MRQPVRVLRYLVLLLALCFAGHAYADDRADARGHFQAGMKFYAGGDYRSAIREFSAAQQLAPADLNNYNLALCYDKLGEAEPAIQYYRAYLDKQPNTDKRGEIEASISRLDAAARSAASKKADQPKPPDEASRGDDTAKPAAPAAPPPAPAPAAGPVFGPAPAPAPEAAPPPAAPPHKGPAVAGTLDSSGEPRSATGDPQLDRINSIDVDQIRDQRLGAQPGGPDAAAAPGAPGAPGVPPGQPGQPSPPAQSAAAGQPLPGGPDQPTKKEDPLYTKWWFWAVVAVSGYVVYELAAGSSSPQAANRGREMPLGATAQPGGLTLLHW